MSKETVGIIIHVPLEAEWEQVQEVFDFGSSITEGNHPAYRLQLPNGLSGIAILQTGMGRDAARETTQHILDRFSCHAYVCLGIAGAISKDVRLGDVCYTGNLIDVYENSKIKDAGEGIDLSFSPNFFETPENLTFAMNFVRTLPEMADRYSKWKVEAKALANKLVPRPIIGRDKKEERVGEPKCVNGDIICGAVSESKAYEDRLKAITRKALAIETESGSIFDECKRRNISAITIRGISDYAINKGDLEAQSEDQVRSIAAHNAAAFLKLQLENDAFVSRVLAASNHVHSTPRLPLLGGSHQPTMSRLLEDIANDVDSKLRELSPHYRTKPSGYRLPMPQIKGENPHEIKAKGKQAPSEIVDALKISRRLLIHVPRAYPDPALAYAVAQGLLPLDLDGKKLVPVVVDASQIRPPSHTIRSETDFNLIDDLSQFGGEYVFIIDSPNLISDTKLNFLIKLVKAESASRIIILTRDNKRLVEEVDIQRAISASSCDLCNVSFAEMAIFLEQSFKMPGPEAEVLALQLRETFASFSLPAHPSFFAGIPSETLAGLLQANRRSELIQLAVDGFLTFVVATDAEKVRLSRTRRGAFLRELVIQMEVEKRSYTESELVELADKMSAEYDYDLQSSSFISDFVEKGIIHFDQGKAVITLPFIKSYLLAFELSKDSKLAARYFDIGADDFDLLTFDLYAEIGPSQEIYQQLSDRLEGCIAKTTAAEDEHILLTHKISPKMLERPASLHGLSNRILKAREAIENDSSDRAEKVRILEVADRVNESVSPKGDEEDEGTSGNPPESKDLDEIIPIWVLATVLLGSGAESLKGNERKKLTSLVLQGASVVLHLWTTFANEYDYESPKRALLKDEALLAESGIERDELEWLIDGLFDFVQYSAISDPIDRVLEQLMEQKNAIIGNSLNKADPGAGVGPMIRGLWLSTIDRQKGKPILDDAIKDLPDVKFFRSILTSLIIRRVKWKMSNKATRLYLLDAAEKIIKPINPNLHKGELLRLVDKGVKDPADSGLKKG